MDTRNVPGDPALAEAAVAALVEALGVSPAQLIAIASRLTLPTFSVAEMFPLAVELCPPGSRANWQLHLQHLVDRYGERSLASITTVDLARLGADIESGRVRGRRGRGGPGARAQYVHATRHLFRTAVQAGHLSHNPAAGLILPRRPPSRRRDLDESELADIWAVGVGCSDDPNLDRLLLDFHRESAARREGGLNLRMVDVDTRRRAVALYEKGRKWRTVPVSGFLARRLVDHGRQRGAIESTDRVFRSRSGLPISRKRYETLFTRIRRRCDWAEALGLSVHWIRHTTATDVARLGGERLAAIYLGHADRSTTDGYSHVALGELRAVHDALFGA